MASSTIPTRLLNTSRGGNATTSTISVKIFSLILNVNVPLHNLRQFPHVLSLGPWQWLRTVLAYSHAALLQLVWEITPKSLHIPTQIDSESISRGDDELNVQLASEACSICLPYCFLDCRSGTSSSCVQVIACGAGAEGSLGNSRELFCLVRVALGQGDPSWQSLQPQEATLASHLKQMLWAPSSWRAEPSPFRITLITIWHVFGEWLTVCVVCPQHAGYWYSLLFSS